jgi:hypothetical protein
MGMTNQIRNPNDDAGVVRYLVLIVISLLGMGACWWAAGPSLGLFFGGLFVATFLTPAGVLCGKVGASIGGFVAVVAPIVAVWMLTATKTLNTPAELSEAVCVLLAYSMAIAGIALILSRARVPAIFASAAAIVLGLAWLTWPVWLSAPLVGRGYDRAVQDLVMAHPPLTINGILVGEPAWTERSVAYHLTDLNQDVPIRLPDNPAICAAVHGIIGLSLWILAFIRKPGKNAAVLNSSATPHTVVPNVRND